MNNNAEIGKKVISNDGLLFQGHRSIRVKIGEISLQ